MDDYLTKPLQVAALAQALEKWLSPTAGPPPVTQAAEPEPAPLAVVDADADAGVSDEQLVDLSRLEDFKEFDDEELTMTRQVVGLFLADAQERLDAIDHAVAMADAAALADAAHALKGAASNVGAVALSRAAAVLEDGARVVGHPMLREAHGGCTPCGAGRARRWPTGPEAGRAPSRRGRAKHVTTPAGLFSLA
jgi:HPt (histidine-containing phosphotransfer) domain-containing protein